MTKWISKIYEEKLKKKLIYLKYKEKEEYDI